MCDLGGAADGDVLGCSGDESTTFVPPLVFVHGMVIDVPVAERVLAREANSSIGGFRVRVKKQASRSHGSWAQIDRRIERPSLVERLQALGLDVHRAGGREF